MRSLQAICFAIATLFPAVALAQLPASCYMHYYDDSFEGNFAIGWEEWDGSVDGNIDVGLTSSARSGASAAVFSFANSDPLGSFLLIEQVINVGHTQTSYRRPKYGCAHVIPEPVGEPDYCSASVWIKGAGDGATGYLELLDPDTFDYLALGYFSVGKGTWTQVSIPSTTACQREMLVRIELIRSSTSSDAMVADDLRITWNY